VTKNAIVTDYLIVGAGAAGMAFADSLIADSDANVVLVDRRHPPGGHWNDAYPFVRLHQPSPFYGVNVTASAPASRAAPPPASRAAPPPRTSRVTRLMRREVNGHPR
jgi:cation diffusion facilitator CzcD-associated flavoprotein CzcO